MRFGLGIYKKYRAVYSYINLTIFWLKEQLIGYDVALNYLTRADKFSIQLILQKYGATIGNNVDIESGMTFHNCRDFSNLIIGNNCHIGKNCFFDLREKIEIQENVVISMNSSFITHLDMSKSSLSEYYPKSAQKIIIKNNTYLGADVNILMGVEAGPNSLIAAGCLVNKNVPPNCVFGGVPGKIIGKINKRL